MSTTEVRWFSFAGRMIAVAGLTVGSAVLFGQGTQAAQPGSVTPATTAAVAQAATQQTPLLNLKASDTDAAFSSSSSDTSDPNDTSAAAPEVAANTADHFNFLNAMQYGGGRSRYGRPRYRGGNTNADGSAKYDFFVGVGYNQPVGNTYHYFSPDWSFQVGGGRNFNKHVGVNLEFNWDNLNLNGRTLSDQSYIYFGDSNPYDNGLDANAHVWSFSLNPIYNIRSGEGLGAYITGGFGFYHKVTNFTIPEEEEYCDPYYGLCEPIEVNGTFDHYTSNAPGVNGGIGFTYKFSRFASERLYAEIRYVVTFNSQRQGVTYADANNPNYTYNGYDFFPANSNRTTFIPVNFGIRF